MIKLVIFAVAVLVVAYLIKTTAQLFLSPKKPKNSCPKCEGKGYWIGTRGREWCDWCKGSGKLTQQELE